MEVRLKVLIGANVGKELLITGPKFFIGRAEDCDLRPRSDLISRHHCVIVNENDFVALRDFGSKNGTSVNNERVVGEVPLNAGDRIKVGPLEFEVAIGTNPALKKKPKVESVKEAAARTLANGDSQSGATDMDVNQWLTPGDDRAANTDTRVINLNETGEIDLKSIFPANATGENAAALTNDANAAQETAKAADESGTHGRKKPGKLPHVAQASSTDSRSAAADVLHKFFKRR